MRPLSVPAAGSITALIKVGLPESIALLTARNIANPGALDLDHVGAEPCQQLRASRSRLDVRKIENANALQRLCHVFLSLRCNVVMPAKAGIQ